MKNIEFYICFDEKKYNRIPGTQIPTGLITYNFESVLVMDGQTKTCFGAMESNIFFSELKYSLQ